MLISPAYAQAAGATSQSDTLLTFLPMVAIFVVFYFLLIRPQQKKQKEARAMLESLNKGDEIVSAGSSSWTTSTQRSKSRPACRWSCSADRSRSCCRKAPSKHFRP